MISQSSSEHQVPELKEFQGKQTSSVDDTDPWNAPSAGTGDRAAVFTYKV